MVDFCQRLVQTPSISGNEGEVANLVSGEMKRLGYDRVFLDEAGNVIGLIKGRCPGRSVMFNTHLDHVDPGRPELWEFDPYGGEIADGYIHGRGASDVKGAIASQVYGPALIKALGLPLLGNILVTSVVQEEPAEGIGIRHLFDVTLPKRRLSCDLVVIGEATSLNISLGHRGRYELEVVTYGRACHASTPWRGVNAIQKMIPVLQGIERLQASFPSHPFLGASSLAVTSIGCSPGRLSIIPDTCTISLDCRLVPGEGVETLIERIQGVLNEIREREPDFDGNVYLREVEEVTYTGMKQRARKEMAPFITPADNPVVQLCLEALRTLGQELRLIRWDFATDGFYPAAVLGIPTIGYAPGEERYAHTSEDRVSIDQLVAAAAGYAAIAMAVAG